MKCTSIIGVHCFQDEKKCPSTLLRQVLGFRGLLTNEQRPSFINVHVTTAIKIKPISVLLGFKELE